ncbi:MAG TPA: PLP-dependent cysteine synthase family protein [Pirellulaceae bacterium]
MTITLGTFPHRYGHQIAATPLVPVRLRPEDPLIWCKLDFLNPSGSTKDRIARYILEKAWRAGKIGPATQVVEASSGSTSIALALACAQLGLRFTALMPEGVSRERVLSVQAYGAEVHLTGRDAGIPGAIAEAERWGTRGDVFLPRQFSNPDNAEAHRFTTAREIMDQVPGGNVDWIVSGVGTGGTLVGIHSGLRECGCSVRPVLARPIHVTRAPDLECCSFSGRIPGVADSLSTIFREADLPDLLTVEIADDQAMATTRRLIRLGFPVGPSSGLNFEAALRVSASSGPGPSVIVTVFPDRMERYFTTELFADATGNQCPE